MSEDHVASQIKEHEDVIETLENINYSPFKRFRRRYTTGRQFITYQVSSVITFLQMTCGSKIWAGLVAKVPWFTGALVKIWTAITTAVATVWGVITLAV